MWPVFKKCEREILKIVLNAEGIEVPLNQRIVFAEAKQKCEILFDEIPTNTGDGHKLSLERHVKQRIDQQFESLEEYIADFKLVENVDTVLLPG